MSLLARVFCSGEAETQQSRRKLQELETNQELMLKKREFLKEKIHQEQLRAKKHCRNNKPVALQALRRKRFYQKQVRSISGMIETMRKYYDWMNELMKDVMEETNQMDDMWDSLDPSAMLEVQFDEDELLVELDRLEATGPNRLEATESDRLEATGPDRLESTGPDRLLRPKEPSAVTSSNPERKMEDSEEEEEQLDLLRRWAIAPLAEEERDGKIKVE